MQSLSLAVRVAFLRDWLFTCFHKGLTFVAHHEVPAERLILMAQAPGLAYNQAADMDLLVVIKQLGISLGLGLLVGLQRERTNARIAGFRTFPLITILGTLCALLARSAGDWLIGLGFLAVAGLVVVANLPPMKAEAADPGLTTEAALLVMYCVGACLVVGHTGVAIALGGGVAVLLHFKPEMHALAGGIGDKDFKAIMQFVLITMVILPVLPNQFYGPFDVLNPFRVWLMVVLIVGISLGGYVIYKLFGARTGALLGAVLGGMISSTATTVSFARLSRTAGQTTGLAAFAILTASTVVFARVLIEIGTVAPGFLPIAARPLGVMLGGMALLSLGLWFFTRHRQPHLPEQSNPSELKPALVFGGLYGLVLLAVAAGKEYFGESGLYVVAAVSGLTDMDAITLSVSQMVSDEKLAFATGWRLILLASLSNLVFKAGIVAVLGNRRLAGYTALLFGAALVIGLLLLALG